MRPFIFCSALIGICSLSAPAHANVGGGGIDFGHWVPRDVTFELAQDDHSYRFFVYVSSRTDEPLIPLRAGEPVAVPGSKATAVCVMAVPFWALAELNGAPPTWEWYLKKWKAGCPMIQSEFVTLQPKLPAFDRRRQLTARYRVESTNVAIRLVSLEDNTSHWWTGTAPIIGACFASVAVLGGGFWIVRRSVSKSATKSERPHSEKPTKGRGA